MLSKLQPNVLNECYNELAIQKVNLKGTVLKPNMVSATESKCKKKSSFRRNSKKNFRLP